MTLKKLHALFERMALKIRAKLSHYPIFYAFIGGIGIVLFWRGVWHIADDFNMESFVSLILGGAILLVSGVFVSEFIGKQLIISGLIGEKKLTEKEEGEIETEETQLKSLQSTLSRLEKKLDHLEDDVHAK